MPNETTPTLQQEPAIIPLPTPVANPPTASVPTVDINAPLKIENPKDQPPEENDPHGTFSLLFLLGIIFFILITVASLAFGVYLNKNPKKKDIATVKTPAKQFSSIKPTPTIELLDKSEWFFEVFNGSGLIGAESSASATLKNLGFEVVKTARTKVSQTTQIYITPSLIDKAPLLLSILGDEFNIATVSGTLKNSTASARLIIGKQ